jgi:hypothetical protein
MCLGRFGALTAIIDDKVGGRLSTMGGGMQRAGATGPLAQGQRRPIEFDKFLQCHTLHKEPMALLPCR